MSESLSSALDGPVVERIGGRAVSFPRFTFDDVEVVIREVRAEQIKKETERLGLSDREGRARVEDFYNRVDMDMGELTNYVCTPRGARHFARVSLRKAGEANPDAVVMALVREQGMRGLVTVAMDLSSFWPPLKRKEDALPNSESPAPTAGGPSGESTSGGASSSKSDASPTAATPAA